MDATSRSAKLASLSSPVRGPSARLASSPRSDRREYSSVCVCVGLFTSGVCARCRVHDAFSNPLPPPPPCGEPQRHLPFKHAIPTLYKRGMRRREQLDISERTEHSCRGNVNNNSEKNTATFFPSPSRLQGYRLPRKPFCHPKVLSFFFFAPCVLIGCWRRAKVL